AALCYFFVFPRWGWRPLFFIGGLPALLALFVRARVKESDVWRETRQETWRGLGRAIVSNWKLFLYLVLLMAMMNLVSHGTQDMYPTFLQRDWGFSPTRRAALTAFSMVGALSGGVVCGLFPDCPGPGRARELDPAPAGAVCRGRELRLGDGALRRGRVRARCDCSGVRARAARGGVRASGCVSRMIVIKGLKSPLGGGAS